MGSPLLRHAGSRVILPPAYMGSLTRYALIGAYGSVLIDNTLRTDKRRKEIHRATVVDTRGVLNLTVPLQSPLPRRWSEALVSGHGRWQQVHIITLASAYGRTPFYEFYADRLNSLIEGAVEGSRLTDLTTAMECLMCRFLGLQEPQFAVEEPSLGPGDVDLRRTSLPDAGLPYHQVRALRLGFQPGMSVIDALCNLGNEAPLLLRDTIKVLNL